MARKRKKEDLRVSENGVLKRILGTTREKVGEMGWSHRKAFKILVGRHRHTWGDNIKTDLKEMAWEKVDCPGQGGCVGLL
jgi:hypothetical protein